MFQRIKDILNFARRLFFETISKLEKSCLLLEKKYADLKKKEEENRKLNQQLTRTNIHLKKELRQKEEELKIIYFRTSDAEDRKHRQDIQRMEKKIAGGFSHRLKNLYAPAVLFNDKIHRGGLLSQNRNLLLKLLVLCKNSTSGVSAPLIRKISKTNDTLEEIFSLSKNAINRNLKIINDFLSYAEISPSGSRDRIFIKQVLEQVIQAHKEALAQNKVFVIQDIKSNDSIFADYGHIFLIIQNLLLNSINAFRKKKPPNAKNRILIRTGLSHDGKNDFILEIIDNGTGIAETDKDKLFKPFFTTDKIAGTGLGLPLCKKIIEMYKGSITVESRPGSGTSFKIVLPQENEE